jgi:UDP-N-acetylglucosamine--dolichyl-phosphate N-acetylglucosaminephosphotransferase
MVGVALKKMMNSIAWIFLASFAATFICTPWIIPKLERANFTGKDMNKQDKRKIPNIGGFAIIFGFSAGVLLAIGLFTYLGTFAGHFNPALILAAFSTILLMAIIGVFDDLFSMHQAVKATLPLFAALPLVAVNAGVTSMNVPFIGFVDIGVLYALVLIPIGITGASNVTNMLAGFNGLEAGMGSVACLSLGIVAFLTGKTESAVLLFSMLGALLAFLYYNWYPAKIFMGDAGTLGIGAVIASAVIVGNYEMAGVIVILPYTFDFFIKAVNGFPSSNWWGEYAKGKLVCRGKPVGLCQKIMKVTGGISEKGLVLTLISIEAVFGILALMLFK